MGRLHALDTEALVLKVDVTVSGEALMRSITVLETDEPNCAVRVRDGKWRDNWIKELWIVCLNFVHVMNMNTNVVVSATIGDTGFL